MRNAVLDAELVASLVVSRGRQGARAVLDPEASEVEPDPITPEERRQADAIARQCRHLGLAIVDFRHPDFPPLLAHIPDPPLALFMSGDAAQLRLPSVAVVGARRCTYLGRALAELLSDSIAGAGWLVVSGLARGIDAAAHRAALASGRTAAVLGSGLSEPYPRCHRALAEQIVDRGGLLVSEYPPSAPPRPFRFPERNRLISGLSRGVLVVEAGERSGSLITARLALEQGRDVMAVPGPVSSPMSRGCHRLIRQGAALVESAEHVFEALGVEPQLAPEVARVAAVGLADGTGMKLQDEAAATAARAGDPEAALSPPQRAVLAALDQTVTSLDRIAAGLQLPVQRLASLLVELELAGFVEQVPGGYIRLPSPRARS